MVQPVLVPSHAPEIGKGERERIARLAARLRGEERKLADTTAFGASVRCGHGGGASVLFGDNSEIPLIAELPRDRLDYRFGYLAGDGDLVVIGGPSCAAFEDYQRRVLGAPGIAYLNADPDGALPPRPTPSICLGVERFFGALARHLEATATPTLAAHITTGTVWALASRLSTELGREVFVAGPPPRLSRFVNDKAWFGRVAAELLGGRSVPPKRTAHGAAALTRHVGDLARKWDRLFLKVPDSAGGAGNYAIATRALRGVGAARLHAHLLRVLARHGWAGRFPLMVEVMDANVLTSPSVQTWIPLPGEGAPVIEGVFEQVLSGDTGMFVGALQADLPPRLEELLVSQAARLAGLFQELGYHGRCSFDAVVCGADHSRADLHWIECNGRWGGVSIPMTLVNRLDARRRPEAYAIVQHGALRAPPRSFGEVMGLLGGIAAPEAGGERVILLSPNAAVAGTGLHLLSCARSRDRALRLGEEAVARLGQTDPEPA